MIILVINSGSTSLKYKLFKTGRQYQVMQSGYIEQIGPGSKTPNHKAALKEIIAKLPKDCWINLVGHRVVHGGEEFVAPTVITKDVLRRLKKYNKLAPLHNPANIAGIVAASKQLWPQAPDIAVFDTAFHRTLPEKAYLYGLSPKYYKKHQIRRYGFHGISHQYVCQEAAKQLNKPLGHLKLISCHLGGGASITAVDRGRSVDTSMGFTPLEGLVMMTRCGDIDPAIPLYLQKINRQKPDAIEDLLNNESGMKALAGIQNADMQSILRKAKHSRQARLALEIYSYHIKKYIGSYYAVLGGLDAIIFTGAVGYGSSQIRKQVTKGLPFQRQVKILPIETNEELMIAKEVVRLWRSRQ